MFPDHLVNDVTGNETDEEENYQRSNEQSGYYGYNSSDYVSTHLILPTSRYYRFDFPHVSGSLAVKPDYPQSSGYRRE